MKNQKGAMEMSVGTIVTIVLLLSVMVLGLVLTRNIMCGGIILTDGVFESAENELIGLFGAKDYGVKCLGEGGNEAELGDGGRRQIFCIINSKDQIEYNLKVESVESLKGASTETVQGWILDSGWTGTVSPGTQTETVLILDVPEKVPDSSLKIRIEEENLDTGAKKTHTSIIDVTHVSGITSAMC